MNVFDVNDNLVNTFTATTSFVEIDITSTEGISRMEFINTSSSFAVFDDFSFTALSATAPPPSGDPVKLDNPIPLPIFTGALKLNLEVLSDGLSAPLWGVWAPGIPDFLYVIDQVGSIWAVNTTTGSKELLADLSSLLVTVGIADFGGFDERGLLGIAFHPDFALNNKLYTYTSQPATGVADFTTMPIGELPNHQAVLTEWEAVPGGTAGIMFDKDSAREVLRIDEPQFNHDGGAIAFDENGYLYFALGDGGGADDDNPIGHGDTGNGQDTDNPLGSIIRINPLTSENSAYSIPDTNPFVGQAGLDEIFAYGLRNPYRFSFDTQTGDLYSADVGQNDIEEINIITSGANYGWNIREGSFGFFANGTDDGYVFQQADPMDTVDPIVEYDHDEGIAVIGGFVYRGSEFTDLQGNYVFGDYNGRVFYINDEGTISEFQDVDALDVGFVLGFAQDSQGDLFVLANDMGLPAGNGTVYKVTLVPNQTPIANAGADQSVNEGTQTTLDATLSTDPDVEDTLQFLWTQTTGTSVTLSDRSSATPSFTAPNISSAATLVFEVEVSDGHLGATSEMTVTVNNVSGGGGGGSLFHLLFILLIAGARKAYMTRFNA